MRTGDKAVIGLAAYVFGWNVWAGARDHEMISEACDRYLACPRWRWLAHLVMALVYLHVSNRLPAWADPIHLLFAVVGNRRKGQR
ncbi:DUF7427 family protein [Mycolicibacterium brisbanense]|uniref:Uncharacterized protein n=1 Tax=Mycolicibacterium brisbanense TaxID=146020 RepID=A0A100W6Z3_9MYCO|nr:hypothetical protein [Mycolicibacterium brisbanense]MCV7158055.1 hypothetical protein [Mycolicibacterium brisbanense]GAS92706.1 uncharacterized protein RMCB_6802 [Mycolicibacterium brisbanense]